jgi:phytoene synthase
MTAAYRRLIEEIASHPSLALASRVSLPRWRKRLLVARGLVGGFA